jgi:signal transduction histidine kinase
MPSPFSWDHAPPRWMPEHHRKRRVLFRRFGFLFLLVMLLFLVALGIILSIVFRALNQTLPRPEMVLLVICGIPAAFVLSAMTFGGLVFRRFGTPLAEVMSAADAVAEGDFSIRVRENVPGEFGQLARSFNRMTAELDRAESQRRNMTADVAHELRTPLQIIQGNLEGILDGVYPPDPEHIRATLDETRLLARLVSDLQTLSLAEAGQLPLHKLEVRIGDLVEDVLLSFAGQAESAAIELTALMDGIDEASAFYVDPDRIDQVLTNLVANAIRHTPPHGKITLGAQMQTETILLSVADSGPGILPEDLPYIFDRFYRGDPARTRSAGSGSGLGLAIARQLVHAHGGKIHAQNAPEGGAIFTLEIPRGRPLQALTPPNSVPPESTII